MIEGLGTRLVTEYEWVAMSGSGTLVPNLVSVHMHVAHSTCCSTVFPSSGATVSAGKERSYGVDVLG